MKREMTLTIDSDSANEAFARTVVAAYVTRLDPTLEELADIISAVSEAVIYSIIHGYGGREGEITIVCRICGKQIEVTVRDEGIGIEDIPKAMEPLYTTKPEWERPGPGFAFMEAYPDALQVISKIGDITYEIEGKKVIVKKR